MTKTVLSFYCDDTNPYVAPPEAFNTFLDFAAAEGIAGEASVILGYPDAQHGLLSRPATDAQRAYVAMLPRADDCGIDAHCEFLTHGGLYDWDAGRVPEGAIHEGVWTYEPSVSVGEFEAYFDRVIEEAARIGVQYSGVTWPGCGCPACARRREELRAQGITEPNPNVWQALLNLARRGRFRGPAVPCFVASWVEAPAARLMAGAEGYGVYDLPPTAADRFGIWLNDPARVDADYYITADGQAGRIVEQVRAGAPYCFFYAHWQGLNPANGVGWGAFTTMVARVRRFLDGQVEWLRPSDYAARLLGA